MLHEGQLNESMVGGMPLDPIHNYAITGMATLL